MLQQQVASLISKKSGISFIVFKEDFTIVDFDTNVFSISDAEENIKIGANIQECFWEFIGNEENILNIKNDVTQSFKIPMLYKNSDYYDIDIEYLEKDIFIAYIIRKSEFSNEYLKAIQILNKNTLISAMEDKKSKQEHNYYNLINQNVLRFHVDLDGIILEVNSICIYFFGQNESDIIGKHFSLFFQTRESQLTQQSKIFNAKSALGDNVLFHAEIIPIHKAGVIYENIIICQDVTHLKNVEKELEYAFGHDSLTGLLNRSSLLKKIDDLILSASKEKYTFSICYLRLKNLKDINKKYGFHAGDMLLKHIALLLSNFIRSIDIVSRTGSHEFVIIFQNLENIDTSITRIKALIEKNPLLYDAEDSIDFSFDFGHSSYPHDASQAKDLLTCSMQRLPNT